MGVTLSRIRLVLRTLQETYQQYDHIEARIRRSPGLPPPNPTRSFWAVPPAKIADHRSDLPKHTDVVIIGSGITGTSVAKALLNAVDGLHVVMLEARQICSGATGRYVIAGVCQLSMLID
jgi:hypothetical protein